MTNKEINWDFGDDLGQAATVGGADDIRASAHIVNGGTATFQCPSCKGTGRFVSYSGRTVGSCFKCQGKGSVSKGVIAAAKGKETKAANAARWAEDHKTEIAYINERASRWPFMMSMFDSIREYGKLTDNQLAAVQRAMAKDAEKKAEFWAAKNAERAAQSGDVGVERINALFATAIENGLKNPVFRTEHLTIKPAKLHPGVLYVTDRRIEDRERGGPAYVGKIVAGKFEARNVAKADTLTLLCEIAGNPTEAATRYGRSTGNCGCCGRELTDPESVAAGIGPICAGKWGI